MFYGVVGAGDRFAPALQHTFRVAVVPTVDEAIDVISRSKPALVVTRVAAGDDDGIAVCTAAKQAVPSAAVLVTTPDPPLVPHALKAGCDGVLLEPFAPNLMYARIGRLMRQASLNGQTAIAKTHRRRAPVPPGRGTNRFCADQACPRCATPGVTTFEFESHRRAWCACVHCDHVWVARRVGL